MYTTQEWGYLLASLNATLNASSAILLLLGWYSVRKKNYLQHARFMVSAFSLSILFLVSYLTRVYLTGTTVYAGQGWSRSLYFTILISHTILAAIVPFLTVTTLYLAIKQKFLQHRRLARFTLPIWLYVSVTGVVIYLMLYHLSESVQF